MAFGSASSPPPPPPRSHPVSQQHHPRASSTSSPAAVSSATSTAASTAAGLFRNNVRLGSLGGDRIPGIIPGFRTSAAFLSSLSANLRIPDDDLIPSPISTPPSLRASADPSGAPSPLASAMTNTDDVDSPASSIANLPPATDTAGEEEAQLPPLATYPATSEADRLAALKLIADSIAQQRQWASRVLIFHPLNFSVYVLTFAAIAQYLYSSRRDIPLILTTWVGLTMLYLVSVRTLTAPYLLQAENLGGWSWLGDDTVLVTKFGEEVIGAVVLGWENAGGADARGRKQKKKNGGRGVIRAWTVRLKYRGKGEGSALLEEAVREVQKKGGDGIGFEEENPYSKRVLPNFYNGPFDKRDRRAVKTLDDIVSQSRYFGKKR